jgi:RNA polymerase sigma factor (sigma-70 family)
LSTSIILSLAGERIPNELTWAAYGQVIRISGKNAIRIFGTRTLLQVIRKLDAFEPRHEGAFLGYVRQTLRNNIADRIRQVKRRGPIEPLESSKISSEPSPYDLAEASQLMDRYEAALDLLKPDQREAIIARIELRLPWPEVATALNKPSVPAAQMAVRRSLVRLALKMSHERKP